MYLSLSQRFSVQLMGEGKVGGVSRLFRVDFQGLQITQGPERFAWFFLRQGQPVAFIRNRAWFTPFQRQVIHVFYVFVLPEKTCFLPSQRQALLCHWLELDT